MDRGSRSTKLWARSFFGPQGLIDTVPTLEGQAPVPTGATGAIDQLSYSVPHSLQGSYAGTTVGATVLSRMACNVLPTPTWNIALMSVITCWSFPLWGTCGPLQAGSEYSFRLLGTLVFLLAYKKSSSLRHYKSICIVLLSRSALDKNTHYNHTIDAHAYVPSTQHKLHGNLVVIAPFLIHQLNVRGV